MSSRTYRSRLVPAALSAVVLLVAGVAIAALMRRTPPSGSTEVPAEALRLTAAVEQSRFEEARRRLTVVVRNDGSGPVRIEALALRAAAFAPLPEASRDSRIAAGGDRLAMIVDYGPARCDGPSQGPTEVAVRARSADDRPQELRLPLGSSAALLERLHRDECAVAAVRRAVDLRFADEWRPGPAADGSVFRGQLLVQRRPDADPAIAVSVTGVEGSVLFDVRPVGGRASSPATAAPLLRLAPGETAAVLPVELRAGRCDPHALIEANKRYTFPVRVALGADPPRHVPVEASPIGRAQLEERREQLCRGAVVPQP